MSARDLFHNAVRIALAKQEWQITHDPLELAIDEVSVKIDLGAERLIGAQRGNEKIAVEIKSFSSPSAVSDFHTALGQCLDYQIMLEENEPERILFLAIPIDTYETFFQTRFVRLVLERYPLKRFTYDPIYQEILQWIN